MVGEGRGGLISSCLAGILNFASKRTSIHMVHTLRAQVASLTLHNNGILVAHLVEHLPQGPLVVSRDLVVALQGLCVLHFLAGW